MVHTSETLPSIHCTVVPLQIYDISTYWWLARWRATVAGAIINVIWLIFLMMAIGTE
jgi:hypothetical protein